MGPDRLHFIIPGDIETRTGGYIYDRRLIAELRQAGWTIDHIVWPASFPLPSPADEEAAAASLAACPDDALVMIDGLACGVLPELMAIQSRRLRLVALCHHPLALEGGLSIEATEKLKQSEMQALKAAKLVIVTSGATADCLVKDYGVPADRIAIARPGIDKNTGSHLPGGAPNLLSAGTVTPRKNHRILVKALATLTDLDWHCTIAGSLTRAPDTAAALQKLIQTLGLENRIALLGEVEDLSPLYRRADIFVLPSLHEGYGMVLAEALAYGIPIVASRVGAISEVVPESAGILVPANDCKALADALRRLIGNAEDRANLAAGAYAASQKLHGWDETAARVASSLRVL